MNTRYVLFLTLLTASCIALPLRAQLVNDGATRALANVTNTFTGDVTVGTNGAFTLLVLSNNALLTNSLNGIIGRNAAAKSNEVQLLSPTARWLMGGDLSVGSNGAMSRLVVSNGARTENFIGSLAAGVQSSNNLALVIGSGSLWSNRADVIVGWFGRNNQMVVSNGGRVINVAGGTIGSQVSAPGNVATVSGNGSIWNAGSALTIGYLAANNRLVIEAGGRVDCGTGRVGYNTGSNNLALVTGAGSTWSNVDLQIGGFGPNNQLIVSNGASVVAAVDGFLGHDPGASNNVALVTGVGSLWKNQFDLYVGYQEGRNQLVVSNGGVVADRIGYLGYFSIANNNVAVVTGAGSVWSNRLNLNVGFDGAGNRLVVSNGGTVLAGSLFVGFSSLSANNRVTVDGGTLRVTNSAANGTLDVRRGTNVLNAGLIEADRLLVTNTLGRFVFNGGTLAVGQSIIAGGLSFDVGDGVSPATLNLTGDGTHSFFIIKSNARLIGNGTNLLPLILQAGSMLSPGTAPRNIGRLASSDSVPLAGTSIMEISKSGTVLTNDQLLVANTITYVNNSLVVVSNLGPTALTAGDHFQLFAAASYGGSLPSISLPPLGFGLRWKNQLLVDGSIEVESLAPAAQTLPAINIGSTNATLNGVVNPKGTSTSAWFEYGFTTNYGFATPPQALGSLDANANFSETATTLIPGFGYHFRAAASNSFGVGIGADQSLTVHAQPDYLKASDTSPLSGFGRLLAVSGNTLVVAGNGAYVFVREGSFWEQEAHLTGLQFIASVAISGDTLVIGDAGDDNNSASDINTGAAYVYVRSGTTWTRQAVLRKSNPVSFEEFGRSVTLSGDTIVVGVPLETHSTVQFPHDPFDPNAPTVGPGINAGTAYVFTRSGTNWSQQAFLRSDHIVLRGRFGSSVAMAGDTIVVGEPNGLAPIFINGVSSFGVGPAHVFVRNGTDWSHQATLLSGNPGLGVEEGGGLFAIGIDDFGASIAISDDTIVVGSPREDSNATGVNGNESNDSAVNSGAAYVYVRSGTNWTPQAYLKASNTGTNDLFGASVAVSGDRIIIGAAGEDSNARKVNGDSANNLAPGAGAAYVFARQGVTWSFQDYLKAGNGESNDAFGVSVALSGDFIAVGANGEDSNDVGLNGDQDDNSATNSGAVYIFGPPRLPTPEITVSHSWTNLRTGASLPQLIAAVGHPATRSVTIKNTGNDFLTGLVITFVGPDAAMFSVAVPPVAPLTPTSNTTFTVHFIPTSGGTKTATLRIASNDENENPFDLQLNELSLSFTEDQDGDGLNDASELLMAPLGFNFQANQTSLVNTLFNNVGGATSNLNGIGFFTQSQLQALNVGTPLLAKDPNTGLFKLTIGVEKATQLTNFLAFPMTAPQTTINAEGKLEFQFTAPVNAAFFRLEAR